MKVETAWRGAALLGEGPVWDSARGVLWFVDIKGRLVHRLDPVTGEARSWPAPAQVGWVLPGADGRLLAGLQTGLATFDPDGGAFAHILAIEPNLPTNRLNDATVATDGTVIFGSMDDGEAGATGRVYEWDGGAVRALDIPAVAITNGPAVTSDGRSLYHVDTVGGVIHLLDRAEGGRVSGQRTFACIAPADGNPDGVVADSAGNVWVGLWGGWRARLYAPSGEILREVSLPAANITKVALGGPDLRTAYATSASIGLSAADRLGQPDAGSVFSFRVEVPGQRFAPARLPG